MRKDDNELDKAIAAHKAAKAIRLKMDADDTPDGPAYDRAREAEEDAMLGVINAECSAARDHIRKLRYIYAHDVTEADGEAETWLIGDDFGPTVLAVRAILEQMAA